MAVESIGIPLKASVGRADVPKVDSPLANQTIERASAGLNSGNGACIPELVKLIHALSFNALEVPVQELATLIEKDASILSKVISAANTLGYNPGAVQISTVTQAIQVIGFDRVRTLAMSLMLLEQSGHAQTNTNQREAAALALCSGLLAQAAAEAGGNVDPEQAFVCASLRNFGRIVLSTFMPEEFAEAKKLSGELTGDDAYRQTFGLTPLELAHALLSAANLPEIILATLKEFAPNQMNRLATRPDVRLLGLSDFSMQLAERVFDPHLSAAEFAQRGDELLIRYRAFLPAVENPIGAFLGPAEARLSQFVHSFGIRSLPTGSITRLKQRLAGSDPEGTKPRAAEPAAGTIKPGPSQGLGSAVPSAAAKPDASQTWQSGISRLEALLAKPGHSPREVFALALQIVADGFQTREAVAFVQHARLPGFAPVAKQGSFFGATDPRPISVTERTVLGVCLSRRENVLIHDASDPKIAPFLPDWLKRLEAPRAFVLLPLFHGEEIHGLILAGWPTARRITIEPAHASLIRTLLQLASRACHTPQPRAA